MPLRTFVFFSALLCCSTAIADSQGGETCTLNINGQTQVWRVSMMFTNEMARQGKFTVRVGNEIIMRNKNFESTPNGFKLQVNLSPLEFWLLMDFKTADASLAPFSGMNPRRIGSCVDSKFEGL